MSASELQGETQFQGPWLKHPLRNPNRIFDERGTAQTCLSQEDFVAEPEAEASEILIDIDEAYGIVCGAGFHADDWAASEDEEGAIQTCVLFREIQTVVCWP